MEKIKVRLFCATHDSQSKVYEDVEVDADISDADLMGMAEEFYYEEKEPQWWFEKQ